MNLIEEPRDFAQSFWLKKAYESALNRDPVDALNDATHLVELLEKRLKEMGFENTI